MTGHPLRTSDLMQAFLNDETRLQVESLPFLLPHAKEIDDPTQESASRIGLQVLGYMAILLRRKVGRPNRGRHQSTSNTYFSSSRKDGGPIYCVTRYQGRAS